MIIAALSDLHLHPSDDNDADRNLMFILFDLLKEVDTIIFVGDLLEMYIRRTGEQAHVRAIMRKYSETFGLIAKNMDRFRFINGNHDDECMRFIPDALSSEFIEIDGFRFIHGHQGDVFFSSKVVNDVVEWVVKMFLMLTGSETVTRSMRHNRIAKDQLLKYVISEYYENGGPSIVAGHTHVKDYVSMPNHWKYINIGATKNGHILLLDTDSGIFKRVVRRWNNGQRIAV